MEIKEIFLEAAQLIESRKEEWMCYAIKKITGLVSISMEISKCEFTIKNYAEFIRKNYPELEKFLFDGVLSINFYEHPWIDTITPSIRDLVLKSKVEFLRSLAYGQENNDSSCS